MGKSRRKNKIKSVFKRKPKFMGVSKESPPMTIRFCLRCEKNRNFKYNPFIGHSECVVCGSRCAGRKK